MPGTKRRRSSSSSETNRTDSFKNEQQGRSPVASTSAQLPRERVITFMDEEEEKPWVEHTTVNRDCSSSKNMTHSSAERPEMSRVASASTVVQIKFEASATDDIEDSEEEVVSDSNAMDRNYSSSPPGQQSLPSVRRSKRVSTMVSKEMEKYFEGCLVMILLERFPVTAGMIRKPDEDPLNHTNVDSGHDKFRFEENGVFYFYVQVFDEPTTLKWFAISNLEIYDAGFEPVRNLRGPNSRLVASMKIANAASKYSVEERLRKFTSRVGSSIGNLLAESENVNCQSTTPLPSPPSNKVTAQSRDEGIAMANGESSTVSVVRVKNLVIDTRRKLRETQEANKNLKTKNSKLGEKIDELEATVRELKRQLDSTSGTRTTVFTLEENLKLKDSAIKAQEKVVTQLRAENLVLQENLEKEREEKRRCQKKLEKMCSEFQTLEELLKDEVNEGST